MITIPPGTTEGTNGKTWSLPTLQGQLERCGRRLRDETGRGAEPPLHFKRSVERPFTRQERDHVTLLFGGLTLRHERLILAGLEGLGYKTALIPTPSKRDFQSGKEYGNNGQCNPTYFTVGALVNYLKRLRDDDGIPTERILDDYVFFTAGACGPCRFGMYEAEYRLALRNSGFDGFRVILFQQGDGLDQAEFEAGLEFDLNFFLSLLNAFFMGDLLNEVAYHIRPYEVEPGRTDAVLGRCLELCRARLREKNYEEIHGGLLAGLISKMVPFKTADDVAKFTDQLRGTYYVDVFKECARILDEEIEVDYARPKPIVKVTGEFWAQTTEGDGNFHMFRFLEGEGAEVLVEPVATWIAYLLNQGCINHQDRRGLEGGETAPGRWDLRRKWRRKKRFRGTMMLLGLAEKLLDREYERLRSALGGTAHGLVDQRHLVRLGHPYYNSRSSGGEGHLEIAKNIYYLDRSLAHMVLSLKAFGCMPSTQSDGAQAAVMADYPDINYLPIETSGEGDINAHSRVQMALGEAKAKCKAEFKACLGRTGYTLDQIRDYVAQRRQLRRALQRIPHRKGVIGRAANFVLHVGSLMDRDPRRSATKRALSRSERR
jgi:predicted nucleotide-binding protein (sugar kinase/HSP70/actin superfamily)